MIRWLTIGLVMLLAVGAVTFDRLSPIDLPAEQLVADRAINPSLSEDPKLNGSWFCPSGSSDANALADHEIVVVNLSAAPAVANISVLTAEGPVPELQLPLAPFGSETQRLADLSDSGTAGAVVEIIGGEGIVGHTVETAQGTAQGTCSSQVSDTWLFANGRTTEDANLFLTVLNPFKDTAIFGIDIQVEGRPVAVQREDLQQTLSPNSVVRFDIGEFITPEENITVKVTTTRGQVVAERLQTLDGSVGPSGVSLQLGVPDGGATSWIFPAGRLNAAGGDQIVVWNPSEEETTTVEVGFWPVDPEDRDIFSFTAVERELQPGRFEVIDLLDEGTSFGIDLPYELGVTVSSSGAPVVAERWHLGEGYVPIEAAEEGGEEADEETDDNEEGEVEEDEGEETSTEEIPAEDTSDYAQPTATSGLATSRGVEVVSQRWVVPWADVVRSQLVITAAEEASVKVEIQAEGQLLAEPILESVQPRGRSVIAISVDPAISAISPNGTITVTSDSNIAAEIQIVDESGAIDIVPAIPTV